MLETAKGTRSPVCSLVRPWGRPMCAPFGPWVVVQVCHLRGSYFSPPPGPALSGSPPLAGSALVGPPLVRLSRCAGGPLPFCSFLPPFLFLFCYLVRVARDWVFESNEAELPSAGLLKFDSISITAQVWIGIVSAPSRLKNATTTDATSLTTS